MMCFHSLRPDSKLGGCPCRPAPSSRRFPPSAESVRTVEETVRSLPRRISSRSAGRPPRASRLDVRRGQYSSASLHESGSASSSCANSAFRSRSAPLPHHAEVAVVERDDLDRRLVLQAGRELLDAHLDRAFAGDAHDLGVGPGELDAHRIGQADAHRAQAAGIDPAPRLVETVVLRRPHLMLADVGRDVGIASWSSHSSRRLLG